ncbi:hypothetical protein ES703_34663 [subsurface metagenome]
MTEKYRKIRYHIEVEHEPGDFDNDMDHLTSDAKDGYEKLQYLKKKYFGKKIQITKITETKTYKTISEKKLLETKIKDSL